jgi:hypothetical protein
MKYSFSGRMLLYAKPIGTANFLVDTPTVSLETGSQSYFVRCANIRLSLLRHTLFEAADNCGTHKITPHVGCGSHHIKDSIHRDDGTYAFNR